MEADATHIICQPVVAERVDIFLHYYAAVSVALLQRLSGQARRTHIGRRDLHRVSLIQTNGCG